MRSRICGRLVESDGRCGRHALNLELDGGPISGGGLRFKGQIHPLETPEALHAVAWVKRRPQDSVLEMRLRGWGGSSGEFVMRRHFPFNAFLIRTGEPLCPPIPTS
jgi:hypothetical protein